LRSEQPKFLEAQDKWLAKLATVVKPFLLQNGGPIVAIQIENEHGSFEKSNAFVKTTEAQYRRHGIEVPVMYTADGPQQLPDGSLPDLPAVINFGSGHAKESFAVLAKERPNGVKMSGEYWAGWFDHWGDKHSITDAKTDAADYAWMVDQGYSVSLYMFEGGTSFGWMNGANITGKKEDRYEPDTTSYDYNAPLDEAGKPREKFFLIRDAIARHTGAKLPEVPPFAARKSFSVGTFTEPASLWQNLPKPVESDRLLTMEELGQNYGYVLYRTEMRLKAGDAVVIDGLHDYALVLVDGKVQGTLDRRLQQTTLTLKDAGKRLDLLVEETGRVNFTKAIRGERKGIVGGVTVAGAAPQRWQMYSLPMDNTEKLAWKKAACEGVCFLRTSMTVDGAADTFLDMRGVHKGFVWLNGTPLGRAWNIGPQYTLYAPGPWLKQGRNDVVVLDLATDATDIVKSVAEPVFAETKVLRP